MEKELPQMTDRSRRFGLAHVLFVLLFTGLAPNPARARGLQCVLLPEIFKIYLGSHYEKHQLNDELKTRTIEQYIRSFDGSRMMLLEADRKKLEDSLKSQFAVIFQGDCPLLQEVANVAIQRAKENLDFVKKTMADPKYKIDETAELDMDSERRGYFKTAADREAFLKKFISFQILNTTLSGASMKEAKKQLVHRYELIVKRLGERKGEELINLFANAFASALDPHSSYLSKKNLEEFEIQMRLSLEGIGAVLSSEDGYTVVEEVMPGGGADRSKQIQPKDKILAVAQSGKTPINVMDMDLSDVVRMIRGKKGTKVTLSILRQKGAKTDRFDVTIVRDKIAMKDQEAKLTLETRKHDGKDVKLGVIELPSFYGEGRNGEKSAYKDIKKLLEQANKDKVQGLVLNLWRNGGGLLDDAVRISGLFIKKGPIVATQNTRRQVDPLADDDESVAYSGPLVVLTSRLSASASEILAGALKDYKRALIVGGDHTFGKGTVQVVNPLPGELGAIKVTTGMFFLPSGVSTQHQGVSSDVALPSIYSQDNVGEKELDYSLKSQTIKSFIGNDANVKEGSGHWNPVDGSLVSKLGKLSKERVSKSDKFAEIQKDIDALAKNKRLVKLAEIRSKDAESKKKKKKENSRRADEIKDAEAPYVNEALNILMDMVADQPAPATTTAKASEN